MSCSLHALHVAHRAEVGEQMASGKYSDAPLALLERKERQVEIREGSERTALYRLLCVNRNTVNMSRRIQNVCRKEMLPFTSAGWT
jgi:hypothetical protein